MNAVRPSTPLPRCGPHAFVSAPPRAAALYSTITAVLLVASGCGPAFRFRSPDILPEGDVEVGGGIGFGGQVGTGAPAPAPNAGRAEIQAWLRGSPNKHLEVGGRFWTHTLNTFGGAFELRIAPVRRPVAFSIDLGLLAAGCCGAGARNNTLAIGAGFDAGFTFGARIGGDFGPAPYVAPHFEMTWTFPPDNDWPKLLFIPVGVDIPLGKSPFHLRPEFLVNVSIYKSIDPQVRLAGGIGFGIQGPGFEKLAGQKKKAPAPATP